MGTIAAIGNRVLLALGVWVLLWSLGCEERAAAPPEPVRPVRYLAIQSRVQEAVHTFSGTARAAVESHLSFKVAGSIQRLPVKMGDHLKKGALIAGLDPADYQIRVQEAQAALSQARAQARNATATYQRIRALYENHNTSLSKLDAARARAESSRAAVRAAEKQLELARRQLAYTRLEAPADCAVAAVRAEVNENVRAGQPIVTITAGSTMEVRVGVPESVIGGLAPGDKAEVRFDALPDQRFSAEVAEVGVSATGTETTFPVSVQLDNPQGRIRPGMAAEVAFHLLPAQADRIRVPGKAVSEDRNGRFVFVITPLENDKGTVHRRPVTVGELTPQGLAILEGLSPGDKVVTAGLSRIRDGQTVRLLPRYQEGAASDDS